MLYMVANPPDKQSAGAVYRSEKYHCSSNPDMIPNWSFKLNTKYAKYSQPS